MTATETVPVRQPRERPVSCRLCGRPTWTYDAICSRHAGDAA